MREVKAASGPNAVQHHPPFGMPPLDVRATSMFIQPRKRPLAPHETAHRLCLQPPSVGPSHTHPIPNLALSESMPRYEI